MQFSLRTLLLLVTAVAIVCSLTMWLREFGIAIAMLAFGFGFLGIGIWQKRKGLIIGGCGLIAALVFSSPWLLTAVCWVGHKKIPVTFLIHDQSGNPIPNAAVELADEYGTSRAFANSNGAAAVVGDFMIGGRDELLRKTGGIQLFRHQLLVKAAGYKSLRQGLDEIVGRLSWDLYAPTPPIVTIKLEREPQAP